jgi:tRNA U34 5-carboxymethylaminomethyl modifying enzyme MnmG/GidA
MGCRTLLLTLNLDRIAWQPCNPAVGGPAKSQLVHEVDAMGGEIGKMADRCYLQKRVLNRSKVRGGVDAFDVLCVLCVMKFVTSGPESIFQRAREGIGS